MKRSFVLVAIAGAAPVASADYSRIVIQGVVSNVTTGDVANPFPGLQAGDTWTFEMVYAPTNPAPGSAVSAGGSPWFDLMSANFSTSRGSISITERDLATFNSFGDLSVFNPPAATPSFANSQFDMFIFAHDPSQTDPLDHRNIRFSPDTAKISTMESILPQDMFGPTAAGERWASFNLRGARMEGLITNYALGRPLSRAVPAPSALLAFGALGLTAARRRR